MVDENKNKNMDPDEYDFGADAADQWLQYDDYGNQGVAPGSQGDDASLAALDEELRMAQTELAKALQAQAAANAKGLTAATMREQDAADAAVTAAQDRVKRIDTARLTAQRMFATRQDSSGYQVLSKANGLMTVYNKAKNKIETIVDPTAKQGGGTVRQIGNRLIRENPDGSLDVVYEAPSSGGASYSPASMMQAEEARESGRFKRETEFPFEQDKWRTTQGNWEQGQENWKLDFAEKQKQRDLDEAWRAAQRADAAQRDAVNLFGTTAQSFSQNLPYAAIPGQSHFLGFEPGGVWEGVAKSRGVNFDPARFQAPVQQYDPNEWWRQAQAMRSGGQ